MHEIPSYVTVGQENINPRDSNVTIGQSGKQKVHEILTLQSDKKEKKKRTRYQRDNWASRERKSPHDTYVIVEQDGI